MTEWPRASKWIFGTWLLLLVRPLAPGKTRPFIIGGLAKVPGGLQWAIYPEISPYLEDSLKQRTRWTSYSFPRAVPTDWSKEHHGVYTHREAEEPIGLGQGVLDF